MVQHTTTIGIFAIFLGQKLPSSSCSELAGAYSNVKPFFVCVSTYAVGSITGPYFGVFRVNNWATVGSITGPHHFQPIKIVVSKDFCEPDFRGGCRVFVAFWCFGPKTGFLKKGMVAIPFFNFLLWWFLVDVTTRL